MKKLLFVLALFMAFDISTTESSSRTVDENMKNGAADKRIELGKVVTGATVYFIPDVSGKWSLEIAGGQAATFRQPLPAQIFLVQSDTIVQKFSSGYNSVIKNENNVTGQATLDAGGGVKFTVNDQWTIEDNVLSLSRKIAVSGNLKNAGFYSTISLCSTPELTWPDVSFLAPSLLYGDCSNNGRGPGNAANDKARRFSFREDYLPAPLMGVFLHNGETMTLLDLAPKGNSVTQEGTIDERYGFGAFGASETPEGGFELGYCFPGTTTSIRSARNTQGGGYFTSQSQPAQLVQPGPPEIPQIIWNRRCHPVKEGFSHSYQIGFRFATHESFPDLIRNSYRWAWQVLKPAVNWHDINVVRKSLSDQLSSQVYTIEGRTGLPFIVSSVTGQVFTNKTDSAFYWRATMGFVGKNIEAADMLLRESERDPGPRGQKMRQQALDVISTFIRTVPMNPPIATGVNLKTGKPSMTNSPQWFIREATDDMRTLMEAYEREKEAGRDHPDWIKWCKEFADWCLTQQRPDGSFARSYMLGTQNVAQESGATSYNVAPLFPLLTKHLGDQKYLNSAIRAAEYVWQNYGCRGIFVGGAIDNPNITDKEAGMLSMEAFMSLYEATKDPRWLHRARIAGDFAETWMWIWNCPMPEDGDNEKLHWKKGVPTIGGQGITAQTAGMIDQFLDLSVPTYAKLYKYTGDEHYLDVARILLHNTKAMLALPGRLYGMHGPGWQQEHWSLSGNRRGYGQPEKWMPWVTTNHLYGIYGMEEFDPVLFGKLSIKP
jgi:hypothetical protein